MADVDQNAGDRLLNELHKQHHPPGGPEIDWNSWEFWYTATGEDIKQWLQDGGSPNARTITPLYEAWYGKTSGNDVVTTGSQSTILEMAVKHGAADTVEALLAGGATPDSTKKGRHYLLDRVMVLRECPSAIGIAKALLDHDPEKLESWMYRDLMAFAINKTEDRNTEFIKLLVHHGVDLESKCVNKRTYLLDAVVNGDAELVKVLIELGANTQATFQAHDDVSHPWDKDRLQYREKQKVGFFRRGLVVRHRYEGQTAYDYAVDKGDLAMVETLAEGGARHSLGGHAATSVDEHALADTATQAASEDKPAPDLDGPPKLHEERARWAESMIQKSKSPDKCLDR